MRTFLILLLTALISLEIHAEEKDTTLVFVMEIRAEIDPRTNRYTDLALQEAERLNADLIILELDTYGGLVTDANDIRTRLLNFEKPIYVFINEDAASAGALISIACDSIYMSPGANIGAATVVTQEGEAAPDKYQSYMRSIMRSTAEESGRDPAIAEAMVDEEVEIAGVTEKGKVLTFSTSEAIENGFCEGRVESIEEILELNDVENYELIRYELESSEKVISFFLNPFISGILILVIIGGIYFELQTPGVGFPLLASLIALILYLTPYYLNDLAEAWEIVLFFVGLVLLGLEIFVIPGFGIAGISGLILMVGSLVLVMLDNDLFDFTFVDTKAITQALIVVLSAMLSGVVLFVFGGVKLADSRAFKRIAHTESLESGGGKFREESYVGQQGIAYTVLRPSGKIRIGEDLLDATTRGSFIEKGITVEVIADNGASLVVREVREI